MPEELQSKEESGKRPLRHALKGWHEHRPRHIKGDTRNGPGSPHGAGTHLPWRNVPLHSLSGGAA